MIKYRDFRGTSARWIKIVPFTFDQIYGYSRKEA
jgi:hypothetical protein